MDDGALDHLAFVWAPPAGTPVRRLVLEFAGLGGEPWREEPRERHVRWAADGCLVAIPYLDPWAWMNPAAVALSDEVVAALRRRYHLDEATPLVATGGSMGGHAALAWSMLSAFRIGTVAVDRAVCDLVLHRDERVDLPRTMHVAYAALGDVRLALTRHSPLHQVHRLPADARYFLVHGDADTAVSKTAHSDRLATALRALGRDITYREAPGIGHCVPLPPALEAEFDRAVCGR